MSKIIDHLIAAAKELRGRYFSSRIDSIVSAIFIGLGILALVSFVRWAAIDSVWNAKDGAECVQRGPGACWAVLHARLRLVIFGVYPYAEQWRPAIGCAVLVATCILSFAPLFWRALRLMTLWSVAFTIFVVLVRGGIFGLSTVTDDYWGGLALTLLVFASMMIMGMPLAIALALARHSSPLRARLAVGIFIDFVRSVPLATILFSTWLLVPLLFPGWLSGDKLTRAMLGFAIFFACYEAEVLRGGLQTIGRGQVEAAKALGMRFWQYQFTVILPQVFRISLPQTMNLVVAAFKDTSYIAILGFFDLVASASAAVGTGEWAMDYVEVYVAVGLLYLIFTYSLARYGAHLEWKARCAY